MVVSGGAGAVVVVVVVSGGAGAVVVVVSGGAGAVVVVVVGTVGFFGLVDFAFFVVAGAVVGGVVVVVGTVVVVVAGAVVVVVVVGAVVVEVASDEGMDVWAEAATRGLGLDPPWASVANRRTTATTRAMMTLTASRVVVEARTCRKPRPSEASAGRTPGGRAG